MKAHLSSRTAGARRGGRIYRGPQTGKPYAPSRVLNAHASMEGARECPTCKATVGIRIDGNLRNHRVGKSQRNSWLCPGEEAPILAMIR